MALIDCLEAAGYTKEEIDALRNRVPVAEGKDEQEVFRNFLPTLEQELMGNLNAIKEQLNIPIKQQEDANIQTEETQEETDQPTQTEEVGVLDVESPSDVNEGDIVRYNGIDYTVTEKNDSGGFNLRGVEDTSFRVNDAKVTDNDFEGKVSEDTSIETEPLQPTEGNVAQNAPERLSEQFIKINNERIAEVRENLALDQLPEVQRQTTQQTYENAIEGGQFRNAVDLGRAVIAGNKVLNPQEAAGVELKINQLAKEMDGILDSIFERKQSGESVEGLNERFTEINDLIDLLTRASNKTGTDAARSLALRRNKVQPDFVDFSFLNKIGRARKGDKLSNNEISKLKQAADVIDGQRKRIETLRQQSETLRDKTIKAKAAQTFSNKLKSPDAKRQVAKKKLQDEQAQILKDIREMFKPNKLNDITTLFAEGAFNLGRLVNNLIKQGVHELPALVERVKELVPEATDEDVYIALIGGTKEVEKKVKSEFTKQKNRLKSTAETIQDIDKLASSAITDINKAEIANKDLQTLKSVKGAFGKLNDLKALMQQDKSLNNEQFDEFMQDLAGAAHHLTSGNPDKFTPEFDKIKKRYAIDKRISDVTDKISRLKAGDKEVIENAPEVIGDIIKTELDAKIDKEQLKLDVARKEAIALANSLEQGRTKKVVEAARTIKATADISAVFRQGFFAITSNPALLFGQVNINNETHNAFIASLRAMGNPLVAEKLAQSMQADADYQKMLDAGIDITQAGGLSTSEETFGARMGGIPLFTPIKNASERHMVTFLNFMRFGKMKEFIQSYPDATTEELSRYASLVNHITGRTESLSTPLGQIDARDSVLSNFLFSPRFTFSRFKLLFNVIPNAALSVAGGGGNLAGPNIRKQLAKDLARNAVTIGSLYGLMMALGADYEWDPRDSDFMKFQFGQTRVDLGAGTAQVLRTAGQLGAMMGEKHGWVEPRSKDFTTGGFYNTRDETGIITKFWQYKLHPAATLMYSAATGKDPIGQPFDVTSVDGALKVAGDVFLPIAVQEIIEQFKMNNPTEAAIYSAMAFMGVGVGTYDNGLKTVDIEKELNRLQLKPRSITGKTPDYLSNPTVKFNYRRDFNNALGLWISDNIIRNDELSDKQKKIRINNAQKKLRTELQNAYKGFVEQGVELENNDVDPILN